MKNWKIGLVAVASVFVISTTQYAISAEAKSFKDISNTHPYFDMISEMADEGIISGYEDGTFKPNEHINRQHAALLINNAVDLSTSVPFKAFNDVNSKHPYYQAIRNLQTADLIKADENGNFNPTKPLTRGEMAKIIATAYELEARVNYTFSDVKGTEYDKYVQALYSNGVTAGYEDGTFKPNEPLTRAHYALFMYKANNLDETFVPEPIGNQETQKPMPIEPSKNVEDYPSDRVVTKDLLNYYDLEVPNGKTINEITKEQQAKALEIKKQFIPDGTGGTTLVDLPYLKPLNERIEEIADYIDVSTPKTIQLINYTYDTGEVYNGGTFYLYFDYGANAIKYSYSE